MNPGGDATPVVIFTNQKGGVGKTTLTRELGIALAARGYSVLLIDSDPQGNLSKSLLEPERTESSMPGLYEVFEGGRLSIESVRRDLSLLSGDARLAALEKRYLGEVDAYEKLSSIIDSLSPFEYDLILIDSPPSLSVMTLNGLAAASHFVIPLRPALYSLQGTNDLLGSVAKVKKSLNPGLELLGVVVNDYLPGPIISRQIKEEIAEGFGEKVFTTVISRTVKVEEAIAARRGLVDERTKVAFEIEALAREFVERLGLPSLGNKPETGGGPS
ncbi:MAG TPA: ParA family protein [Spirochaetia bacterium]|nr:ParA family protein [Spirochaetia bacterium]